MNLEEQLRADFDRAAQEMPLAALSWDQTLARARRGRALRFASLTAAAALVAAAAVVGANTLADQQPTPAPPASPKPSPTELERYEVPPGAKAVVRRYVEALGAGDARTGWALLGERGLFSRPELGVRLRRDFGSRNSVRNGCLRGWVPAATGSDPVRIRQ